MLHQPTYAPVPLLAADVNCFWALAQDQESYNREVHLPDEDWCDFMKQYFNVCYAG